MKGIIFRLRNLLEETFLKIIVVGISASFILSCMASPRVLKSLAPKLCNALRFSGARFLCENPTSRPSPKAAVQSFGVLLDIDGVLIRGRNPIPGAKEALEMLHQSDVPTVFLTNGGCEFEKETAERISHRIGFEVIPCCNVFI